MRGQIKDQAAYEATLIDIYFLLNTNIKKHSKDYIKLGNYCVLVNHFQNGRKRRISRKVLDIYRNIHQLLERESKQKMMKRIGIHVSDCPKTAMILRRATFSLTPEIVPFTRHL